jgi:ubiquinone/menaquinone biosynthesis C-methylase UbiE
MSSFSRFALRAAYGARQISRVGWYIGHGGVIRWLAEEVRRRQGESKRPRPQTNAAIPGRDRLYADMAALFQRDLANVEAGIYPFPMDHDGSFLMLLNRSRLFFEDLPDVYRRREGSLSTEVLTREMSGKRPLYYLQNFHFQSGGYLTDESARRYDTQVEVVFNGTANAVRRQALPHIHEILAGRDQRSLKLLDVGCGTGRFSDFAKQAWPRLPAIGLDMSEAYLKEARRHLKGRSQLNFIVGKGEAVPLPDESQDVVTTIFMFHELPPDVRRRTFSEFARVLKPGGRAIIVDSIQRGDKADYDGLLELFPQSYHEPYYLSYIDEDFGAIGKACGLAHTRSAYAYMAKVMVFDKLTG